LNDKRFLFRAKPAHFLAGKSRGINPFGSANDAERYEKLSPHPKLDDLRRIEQNQGIKP
jgi:hypothetical protein